MQICAGIASSLGRLARVSPKRLRRLLPVGAAAGIAAAFNAPIAAVTFTIEEVVGNLDQSVLSGVIVAAALAAVIERSILGEHPIFDVPPGYGMHHASSLAIYALLGLAAAVASIAFTDGLLSVRSRFRKLKALPRWAHPGVGGLATGVLAAAALYGLKTRGVTGGGYETLSDALSGKLAVEVMLALCGLKIAATISSYSSGGAGGIFAPSLFMGGMLGGAFGALDIRLFGHADDTIGAFALVGMGAVFAGVIRAPITSVLIIIEMTSGYSLILPLMIANMTAYGLARHWRPTSIYEALLEQDGVHLRPTAVTDGLESVRIASVLVDSHRMKTYAPETSVSSRKVSEPVLASPASQNCPLAGLGDPAEVDRSTGGQWAQSTFQLARIISRSRAIVALSSRATESASTSFFASASANRSSTAASRAYVRFISPSNRATRGSSKLKTFRLSAWSALASCACPADELDSSDESAECARCSA